MSLRRRGGSGRPDRRLVDRGGSAFDVPEARNGAIAFAGVVPGDAPQVQRFAGAGEIAAPTSNILHPYEHGVAEAWIETHPRAFENQTAATFGVVLRSDLALIGALGLALDRANRAAELGSWIGVPYWNCGFCTEAGRAALSFGFEGLGLHRIMARHMTRNPASGRVMQKLGMTREGTLRGSFFRWGSFGDAVYAILKPDLQA